MKVNIVGITDKGLQRENNEDAFCICLDLTEFNWNVQNTDGYVDSGKYGTLAVVTDGMGGENCGEIASSIAVKTVQNKFSETSLDSVIQDDVTVKDFFKNIIADINLNIRQYESENPDSIGMGTTIVMAWLLGNKVHITWCGDSRCYVFSKDGLKRITKDHSYVQQLIDEKKLDEDSSFLHPQSNIITKYLGGDVTEAENETVVYETKDSDILLLCSDGLCGYVRDKEIENIIKKHKSDLSVCKNKLLEYAYERKAPDNITMVLLQIESKKQNLLQRMFKNIALQ